MKVLEYIDGFEGNQREILEIIHFAITDIPGIIPKIRFKIPFYYRKTWVCYLNPVKRNAVELCFVRGNELLHSKECLNFGKRVQVGGLLLTEPDKIDMPLIMAVVNEALELDEFVPYTFKKKK